MTDADPQPRRRGAASQPLEAASVPDALLRLPLAAAVAGLSVATLYRRAATDPTFPQLVRMGSRCTRVRAGDLTAWLARQGG